ncbi:MAP kinase-activated protein kinase 2 (Fragment) [Seminavis robusta]|uniref:non-specific serine/threonine protein kinase n=1 Tax=Seminavis robusta TaxID=568900 RepID=A0A9N8HUS6_9STRA
MMDVKPFSPNSSNASKKDEKSGGVVAGGLVAARRSTFVRDFSIGGLIPSFSKKNKGKDKDKQDKGKDKDKEDNTNNNSKQEPKASNKKASTKSPIKAVKDKFEATKDSSKEKEVKDAAITNTTKDSAKKSSSPSPKSEQPATSTGRGRAAPATRKVGRKRSSSLTSMGRRRGTISDKKDTSKPATTKHIKGSKSFDILAPEKKKKDEDDDIFGFEKGSSSLTELDAAKEVVEKEHLPHKAKISHFELRSSQNAALGYGFNWKDQMNSSTSAKPSSRSRRHTMDLGGGERKKSPPLNKSFGNDSTHSAPAVSKKIAANRRTSTFRNSTGRTSNFRNSTGSSFDDENSISSDNTSSTISTAASNYNNLSAANAKRNGTFRNSTGQSLDLSSDDNCGDTLGPLPTTRRGFRSSTGDMDDSSASNAFASTRRASSANYNYNTRRASAFRASTGTMDDNSSNATHVTSNNARRSGAFRASTGTTNEDLSPNRSRSRRVSQVVESKMKTLSLGLAKTYNVNLDLDEEDIEEELTLDKLAVVRKRESTAQFLDRQRAFDGHSSLGALDSSTSSLPTLNELVSKGNTNRKSFNNSWGDIEEQIQTREFVCTTQFPQLAETKTKLADNWKKTPPPQEPHKLQTLTQEPSGEAKKDFISGREGNFEDFYQLGEMLGEGEFGAVHSCTHKETGNERAVKIILKEEMSELEYDNVIQEFQILTDIDNPNVIRVYEFFSSDEKFYIVQELAMGGDLFDELAEQGRIAEKEVLTLMRSILGCVQYLAKRNVCHRDLNLENILLDETKNYEKLKVIDFGLAARCEPGEKLFEMVGKPRYISPEVLGDDGYDLKYDIWSAGVTAYTLMAGYHPFEADHDVEVYQQIVDGYFDFKGPEWETVSNQAKDL